MNPLDVILAALRTLGTVVTRRVQTGLIPTDTRVEECLDTDGAVWRQVVVDFGAAGKFKITIERWDG